MKRAFLCRNKDGHSFARVPQWWGFNKWLRTRRTRACYRFISSLFYQERRNRLRKTISCPTFKKDRTRSVLCWPVSWQSKRKGISFPFSSDIPPFLAGWVILHTDAQKQLVVIRSLSQAVLKADLMILLMSFTQTVCVFLENAIVGVDQ